MKIKMSIIRELIEDWFGMVGEYSYYGEDGKDEFKKMAMHNNPEAIDDFINFAAQQGAGEYDEIELDSIRPKLEDLIAVRAKEELRDYVSEIKNKKRNMGQKIQLSESQLRNLIKESVKKAIMNEISSDMIGRASRKFHQKYGGTDFPGPDAKDFPKDEYGNLLYPKDKRTLAQHYRNFNDAYNNAKYDEEREDPETMKAIETAKFTNLACVLLHLRNLLFYRPSFVGDCNIGVMVFDDLTDVTSAITIPFVRTLADVLKNHKTQGTCCDFLCVEDAKTNSPLIKDYEGGIPYRFYVDLFQRMETTNDVEDFKTMQNILHGTPDPEHPLKHKPESK